MEYPHAPCMEYLPTFIIGFKPNVGTYFIKHLGYLDLPKGAKWFLKGVNSPSLSF